MMSLLASDRSNGFYIEAGAFDGEYLTNTILFERMRNWTGEESVN